MATGTMMRMTRAGWTVAFVAVAAAWGGEGTDLPPLPVADPPVVREEAQTPAPASRPAAPVRERSVEAPAPARAAALPFDGYGADEANADGAEREEVMTFLGMLRFGWQINLIVGILGFFGLFLFFYFLMETRGERVAPKWILDRVADAMAVGKPAAAVEIVERDSSLLAWIAAAGLRQVGAPRERIKEALESSGRRVLGRLRQQVNYLANIGVLSPMLGLLGTVTGLMKAFNVLGAERLGEGYKAALLGSAIGEAMVTTAVGLIVGIPAMALHFLALDRLGRVGDTLEAASERLSESLCGGEGEQGEAE